MHRWAVLAAVAACSGNTSCSGPQQVGSQPSWRQPGVVAPVTFAPAAQPVTRYNEPVSAPPHTPLGDAIIAATKEEATRLGIRVPVADSRLFQACAELAEIVPEQGVLDNGIIDFVLQRNGILEPLPHLIQVWTDDSPTEIAKELQAKIPEMLKDGATARLGIGWAKRKPDGTNVVVFVLQGSGISTAPIPRSLPANGGFTLDGVLDARYRDPEVFVTHDDDGSTERLEIRTSQRAGNGVPFSSRVSCTTHKGRQQVEILASDAAGSNVLANFPVWCAMEPPLTMTVESPQDDTPPATPEEAEKRLFAMVNHDRTAAGLPALVWDDHVAEVARKYSDEMHRTKIVAHVSPTSGSAADRVRAGNIKTAVVLENVARAYGVHEAHYGLMNSPGHRANLMSHAVTTLGIGIAFGDDVGGRREMFITQVFIRVPPKIDPVRAAQTVVARIDKVHKIGNNDKLSAIAQELADALAKGKTRDEMWPQVKRRVDALGGLFTKVGSVVTAAADLDTVDGKQLLGDYVPDEIGVGIAQGTHPEIGDGAIWIVVLMAERRP
jgi:uncharacterized protein YkwD